MNTPSLYEYQNYFWLVDEQKSFSSSETRLYFYLLHLFNRYRWVESIEFADKKLAASANLSLQVLKSSRKRLADAGLITYAVGGGFRVKTKYRILAPTSTLSSAPSYNKSKNNNSINNGTKKGFVYSGSDFD
jgi:hypothetical protein